LDTILKQLDKIGVNMRVSLSPLNFFWKIENFKKFHEFTHF
jgi:hypothetical protein